MNEFHASVKELSYVSLGQIGTAKPFIRNALFRIFSWIEIDIIFSSVQEMGHSNVQQKFDVFCCLTRSCNEIYEKCIKTGIKERGQGHKQSDQMNISKNGQK